MNDQANTGRIDDTLPQAPKLWTSGVFGASAIFTALAIGAGELMFWPSLVLSGAPGVLWVALLIIMLQWVVNIEVARFSLATGEGMGEGSARRSRVLGFLLLLGAIVPWIWPGWIRSGGQLLAGLTGQSETIISLISILACAALLSLPRVIYPLVEKLQSVMLAIILVGVLVLFGAVAMTEGGAKNFFSEFFSMRGALSATSKFATANGTDYYALLGGVVFAGAGGILNLGYGLLLAEKGAGMGEYRNRLVGIGQKSSISEAAATINMADTMENRQQWKRWIRVARTEHLILFFGGNAASVIFVSAIFYMLFAGSQSGTSGVLLLVNTFAMLTEHIGEWAAVLFAIVGFLVFFTSALGILHVTSRIAAGIASELFGGQTNSWFHRIVWGQYVASSILIWFDPRQPFWLLVTSAILNTLVMAIYAFTILWLNRRSLPSFAQAPKWSEVVVAVGGAAYAFAFLYTVSKVFG